MKGSYRLLVQAGPGVGTIHELTKDIITIGRDLRNDVVVNDAEVSRTHTRLTRQADGWLVEDLMSQNSTYVNGQRLSAPKVIRPGDLLGLGETVALRLDFAPEQEVVAPVVNPPVFPPPPTLPASQISTGPFIADAPSAEPKKRGVLFYAALGCGCLTLLACAVLIPLALFLWNAPVEFWQSLGLG